MDNWPLWDQVVSGEISIKFKSRWNYSNMMSVHLKWKRQRIKAGREVQFIPLWPADPARPSPMSGFIGYGIDNALFKAFVFRLGADFH